MVCNKLLCIGLLIAIFNGIGANYTLNIMLNEFNNGQGLLADGSHCDNFWFSGYRCDIQLKIAVLFDQLNSSAVDLGNVTSNANSIIFGQQQYGAWYNPASYVMPGQYSGFSLFVLATEAKTGKLIDSFTTSKIGADQINDFTYFSHPRMNGNLEPTMIAFAWFVQGDVSSPQPSAPPTVVPTTKPAAAGYPDCEAAYADNKISSSGPQKLGLLNGNTVTVYCEIDPKTRTAQTVFQSRGATNPVAFNSLELDKYKIEQGKAEFDGNYWMGLDNMNAFTHRSSTYNMSIIACCGEKPVIIQVYENVSVSNAATGYTIYGTSVLATGLNYRGISTDFNSPFRTVENFNTTGPTPWGLCPIVSKAPLQMGGWWFGNCLDNLNGHYYALNELNDNNTCTVKTADLTDPTKGPGIELYNSGTVPFKSVVGVSYTRVRMAFYRANGNGFSSNTGFCSSTAPPTSAPATGATGVTTAPQH